jgi:hypothetical protein
MSTANFIVIQDSTSHISDNPIFAHPSLVEFPAFGAIDADLALRPVLTLEVSASGDVTLLITLNRVEVINETITQGFKRMMSEVVNENILQANSNELIVAAIGPGHLTISDIILWYRK